MIEYCKKTKALRIIPLASALLLIMPLGGCISLFPKKPPQEVAPFVNNNTISASHRSPYSVVVSLPSMPFALSGNRVAILTEKQTYAYLDGIRLASPAPTALQDMIISTFEKSGAFRASVRDNASIRSDYQISIDVTRFDIKEPTNKNDGEAVIEASVKLIDFSTRKPLASNNFIVTSPAKKGKPIEATKALQNASIDFSYKLLQWVQNIGDSQFSK